MHLLDATKCWRPESLLVFEPEAAVTLFGKDPQDTLAKVGHLVINLCTDWNRMYSQKVIIYFFLFFVILLQNLYTTQNYYIFIAGTA